MFAIDDGIASGNLNAADVFFLIGMILGLIAALLYAIGNRARASDDPTVRVHTLDLVRWGAAVGWLGVASVAFGLLQL